jgi:pimeloyl-ACP methyl ester carboxylesterase
MNLHFRKYGSGKPLIILHGIFGISDNWVSFGKRISELGFEVYILDQRNHGRSPHHYAFTYYALVDDLVEFIEQQGLEDPVILGHSMGGKVAMRYTLENPDDVSALVVVDTSMRTYVSHTYHLALIDAMKSVDFSTVKSRQEVEEFLSTLIDSKRIVQFLMKNLFWKEKEVLGWRINLEAIDLNLDSMYDGVFYSTVFSRPALFVRGGRSDYIIEEDIPAIKKNFNNMDLATIDEGTHWVHADAPEEFYGYVSDFLMGKVL